LNRKPLVNYSNEDPWNMSLCKYEDIEKRVHVISFRSLIFENVHFSYPSRPTDEIIQGLTITINRGDQCALTGPSGSGKSTVMQNLMRFYDPNLCVKDLYDQVHVEMLDDPSLQHEPEAARCLRYLAFDSAGRIFLKATTEEGGPEDARYSLRTGVDLRSWRNVIGYVGQEPILYDMSAKENILFGLDPDDRDRCSNADLLEAARQANVDFIGPGQKFDWDTPLGGRAGKISGGQRQRLAIARALLRKPQILLLDEATSALDNASQKEVQGALDALLEEQKGELTTITIAHRLSIIANCNKIMVLVQGQLSEQGNWDELCEIEGGVFAGLVAKSKEGA